MFEVRFYERIDEALCVHLVHLMVTAAQKTNCLVPHPDVLGKEGRFPLLLFQQTLVKFPQKLMLYKLWSSSV